jgi:DNA-binding MarR family transcriptional regulator
MTTPSDSERRSLVEQLGLLSEVDATQTALFQQAAAAKNGLSVTDMKAISIVLREGPQTAGALVSALHLTSGAVTGLIDRLQKHGLVRREEDPSDLRKVIVVVDLEGLASRDNVYLGIGREFDALYEAYSLEELRFLERHLRASIRITIQETTALQGDDRGRADARVNGSPGRA